MSTVHLAVMQLAVMDHEFCGIFRGFGSSSLSVVDFKAGAIATRYQICVISDMNGEQRMRRLIKLYTDLQLIHDG